MERPVPVLLCYGEPGDWCVPLEEVKKLVSEYLEYVKWLEIQLSYFGAFDQGSE